MWPEILILVKIQRNKSQQFSDDLLWLEETDIILCLSHFTNETDTIDSASNFRPVFWLSAGVSIERITLDNQS